MRISLTQDIPLLYCVTLDRFLWTFFLRFKSHVPQRITLSHSVIPMDGVSNDEPSLRVLVVASLSLFCFVVVPDVIAGGLSLSEECDRPLSLWLLLFAGAVLLGPLPERLLIRSLSLLHRRPVHQRRILLERWIVVSLFVVQLMKLMAVGLFVLGHVWLWATKACAWTSPLSYYAVLCNLVLVYLLLVLPLLVVLGAWMLMCVFPERVTVPSSFLLPVTRGLTVTELEDLQVITYPSQPLSMTTCVICCCDFCPEEVLRILKCSHVFHRDCVDVWLKAGPDGFGGHRSCPLCLQDPTASS